MHLSEPRNHELAPEGTSLTILVEAIDLGLQEDNYLDEPRIFAEMRERLSGGARAGSMRLCAPMIPAPTRSTSNSPPGGPSSKVVGAAV
jgi:hypothetical protein